MDSYSHQDLIKLIFQARIYDVCTRTPLDFMPNISSTSQNQIWIKREDKQPIFSFKIRGAYHKIKGLSEKTLKNGVITASAGNHAQGVALSAKIRKIKATIFMPLNTSQIKLAAVKKLGAKIVLTGSSFNETYDKATSEAKKRNIPFIEAFNDHMIIAGQGTIGLEILQDCVKLPDAVFVPIGGGGLISGIAMIIKELYPNVKIIGVEPVDSNAMTVSIKNDKIKKLSRLNSFADGVAIAKVGEITFDYCKKFVDDYINVTTDEICAATKIIHNDLRAVTEPSGALGLAGTLKYIKQENWRDKNLITINTGANMDFDRLKFVVDRTKIGEGREVLLAIHLKERPGTLKKFCKDILSGVKISEFNYRYDNKKLAVIFLGLEVLTTNEINKIYKRLSKHRYSYLDLTNDELAKYHLRYILRGRASLINKERFFQCTFPEEPGALYNFLAKIGSTWNITLAHHRSYGGTYSKIFIGIDTSAHSDNSKLDSFMKSLQYQFTEETDNQGFKMIFTS
ncbi:MAG: threonine ammonia-lyase, biosynthetic [SAR324 cluster bacterium]|nr:threonine ammonia-lyase, biosynthetic [SAR324 cluster bacterium]